jgi:hypothetical protein
MKRNINLIVLTFEITAIIILHAVKIGGIGRHTKEIDPGITKAKKSATVPPQFSLISAK